MIQKKKFKQISKNKLVINIVLISKPNRTESALDTSDLNHIGQLAVTLYGTSDTKACTYG